MKTPMLFLYFSSVYGYYMAETIDKLPANLQGTFEGELVMQIAENNDIRPMYACFPTVDDLHSVVGDFRQMVDEHFPADTIGVVCVLEQDYEWVVSIFEPLFKITEDPNARLTIHVEVLR